MSALAIHARAAATLRAGLRALGLPAALLLPLACRGALLSLACAGAVAAAHAVLAPLDIAGAAYAAASLAAGAGACLLLGLAAACARPAVLGREVQFALSRVLPFVPTPAMAGGAR